MTQRDGIEETIQSLLDCKEIQPVNLKGDNQYTGVAVPLGFGLSFCYSVYFFLRDRLHLIKSTGTEDTEELPEGGVF